MFCSESLNVPDGNRRIQGISLTSGFTAVIAYIAKRMWERYFFTDYSNSFVTVSVVNSPYICRYVNMCRAFSLAWNKSLAARYIKAEQSFNILKCTCRTYFNTVPSTLIFTVLHQTVRFLHFLHKRSVIMEGIHHHPPHL